MIIVIILFTVTSLMPCVFLIGLWLGGKMADDFNNETRRVMPCDRSTLRR